MQCKYLTYSEVVDLTAEEQVYLLSSHEIITVASSKMK